MSETQGYSIADASGSGNGAGPHSDHLHGTSTGQGQTQGRPEIALGAAFVGGFVLAMLVRRARS